jgi:hypothetical protein
MACCSRLLRGHFHQQAVPKRSPARSTDHFQGNACCRPLPGSDRAGEPTHPTSLPLPRHPIAGPAGEGRARWATRWKLHQQSRSPVVRFGRELACLRRPEPDGLRRPPAQRGPGRGGLPAKQVLPETPELSVTLLAGDQAQTRSSPGPWRLSWMSGSTPRVRTLPRCDRLGGEDHAHHRRPRQPVPEWSQDGPAAGVTHTLSVDFPVAAPAVGALNVYNSTGSRFKACESVTTHHPSRPWRSCRPLGGARRCVPSGWRGRPGSGCRGRGRAGCWPG